jgi:hypothetical protein
LNRLGVNLAIRFSSTVRPGVAEGAAILKLAKPFAVLVACGMATAESANAKGDGAEPDTCPV